ncbi:MAG: signal recognition particle-docking protein FtsY [Chitinophagales bacterium]|jgi:fused signal recognition particle receptor|nr:signal recognition particle-docking protein FtsY [Chitinophagales bacterium]
MSFKAYFTQNKQKDLEQGLEKTKSGLFDKFKSLFLAKSDIDSDLLDDIEQILLSSDIGMDTTIKIIDALSDKIKSEKYNNLDELVLKLREVVEEILAGKFSEAVYPNFSQKPHVVMIVGINGVGKTTTIGKLAYQFKESGKKVVLGAGDTFRAASVEQLRIWANRSQVDIIEKGQDADPSSVAYDTMHAAKARQADIVLLDTAGRLHNKINLMEELSKIKRVMSKVIPDAPHEVLLVLDATSGQNAINQAKEFLKATQVNGLVLTKLDGTAKGGVVISIADQLNIPIRYIGVGEQIDQLQRFDAKTFITTLFSH